MSNSTHIKTINPFPLNNIYSPNIVYIKDNIEHTLFAVELGFNETIYVLAAANHNQLAVHVPFDVSFLQMLEAWNITVERR